MSSARSFLWDFDVLNKWGPFAFNWPRLVKRYTFMATYSFFLLLTVDLAHFLPLPKLWFFIYFKVSKSFLDGKVTVATNLENIFLVYINSFTVAGRSIIGLRSCHHFLSHSAWRLWFWIGYLILQAFDQGYKIAYFWLFDHSFFECINS